MEDVFIQQLMSDQAVEIRNQFISLFYREKDSYTIIGNICLEKKYQNQNLQHLIPHSLGLFISGISVKRYIKI